MPKTWGELKLEIKKECNILTETFVDDLELLTWCNDVKVIAEKEIVGLYDKYFEMDGYLSLINGQALYDLPPNILATKITGMYYVGSSSPYEVLYAKDKKDIIQVSAGSNYSYRIINDYTLGQKIKLYPAARENAASIQVFYIRNSKPIATDASIMDVPIAEGFIKQYIKDKIKEAELGPLDGGNLSQALGQQQRLMIEALNDMIPDDTRSEIRADFSFYDDVGI